MSPSYQRIAGHPRRSRRSAPYSDARPRRGWSQMLTTLIALGALVFTGVSVFQTGRQNAQQDSLTTQGQITDRYTAAVNQIGSPTLDVRLGGIYALERIMRDSPADQPTIVEVLSAFVRDHPPGAPKPTHTTPSFGERLPLPTDVAAALTVLSRRTLARDGASTEDLSETNFANTDLTDRSLPGANLTRANLAGTYLTSANLSGAILSGADLTDADLTSADLAGVILSNTTLTSADLTTADLASANLIDANLSDSDLADTNLAGTNLAGVNLVGADLTGTSFCDGLAPSEPGLHYQCKNSVVLRSHQ